MAVLTRRRDDFVDNFHTCLVLKNLAKIEAITGDDAVRDALRREATAFTWITSSTRPACRFPSHDNHGSRSTAETSTTTRKA